MRCSKCTIEKPLNQFIKNKQCKNGHARICRDCQNKYSREWKRKNSEKLSKKRRKRYAETKGVEVKKREEKRKQLYPLRRRCQLLRSGMKGRAKLKRIDFDKQFFTVSYLIDRLSKYPNCECCNKRLDIGFKKDKKFNDASPSMDRVNPTKGYIRDNVAILCWQCNKHKQDATAEELRKIADFMDVWGNQVQNDIEL